MQLLQKNKLIVRPLGSPAPKGNPMGFHVENINAESPKLPGPWRNRPKEFFQAGWSFQGP